MRKLSVYFAVLLVLVGLLAFSTVNFAKRGQNDREEPTQQPVATASSVQTEPAREASATAQPQSPTAKLAAAIPTAAPTATPTATSTVMALETATDTDTEAYLADEAAVVAPALGANGLRLPLPVFGSGEHMVAIDPGHGGIDEGTYPYNPDGALDYHESEVNLQIALRLKDILVANGIRVFLVRDGDYEINPNWLDVNGDGVQDIGDESQARIDLINASGAELMLSIHQNARTLGDGSLDIEGNGSTTYYCDARPFSDQSFRLAELVHQQVLEELASIGYTSYDQGILDDLNVDDYEPKLHFVALGPQSDRIARPSQMPGVIDEPLFATNVEESVLLGQPEVWDTLAQAYANAIIAYLDELDAR
ncbi:MAG: N-acetylmuramoyl-L-alanine amidase [Chloroflexi bacterium]|nr:N-acetylmuramoyl-L-alanine amidase [Chloroflexota bacterium]